MALAICWGWPKGPGPTTAGSYPAIFLHQGCAMKELSVFIDESGDFGLYDYHSRFYIVALVFHDQSADISENIKQLNAKLHQAKLSGYTVHAGPLIRRENEYEHLYLIDRKRIFNIIYNFARTTDISYHTLVVDKRQLIKNIDLNIQLTKQLSTFLKKHLEILISYDRIVVYYDYGQKELTNILVSVFGTVLNNVEFKNILPANYKLLQAADMFCTLELLSLKAEKKLLSKSELSFFASAKYLRKAYLDTLQKKRFK
ncbi:MAG: DUF3800 domain-containing protein [Lachnospiraceae bacterium]|jgi:hypothetical protein|nr:DUF3800 domain-containing protein [Lachnospiraceae bacterium]